MVRLDLYDTTASNGDNKYKYAFDIYNETSTRSTTLPYYVENISDTKPTMEGLKTDVAVDIGEQKVVDMEDKDGMFEKPGEKLSDIWWDFLGDTSLHGCKNVKERRMAKRLVWCCLLMLMTVTLTWALTNLFLKYQQHPFVSVWGFQRESTVLAPGVTICLPSRFNKWKLEKSRPAYQLLAYEAAGTRMFEGMEERVQPFENLTEQLKVWEKELETVTVAQARWEIGFSRWEIIPFAQLQREDSEIDISGKMVEMDTDTSACWWIQWLLPDEPFDFATLFDHNITSSESDASRGKLRDTDINTTTSEPRPTGATDNTLNWTSFLKESLLFNTSDLLSTPSPSDQPVQLLRSTATTTEAPESGGDQDARDYFEDEREESARTVINHSDQLRLEPHDSITFMINLQQDNWLGEAFAAGVDLHLHDPNGAFWSVNPIRLRPGTFNSIHYKTTQYKFLPPPYKSFGGAKGGKDSPRNTGCVDTQSSSFQSPMVRGEKAFYSSDMCMLEYATNKTIQRCGCGVNRFYNKLHGTPECSILQHIRCYEPSIHREYGRLEQALATGNPADQLCPQACSYNTFETSTSASDFPAQGSAGYFTWMFGMEKEAVEENLLVIQIQPQGPLSVTVEHVPELTVLGILGSVGGWMGLCLGASLLTLTEFFEAVAVSVWTLYRKLGWRLRG